MRSGSIDKIDPLSSISVWRFACESRAQPRTWVLGERSESADVHRGSDEPASQAAGLFRLKLAHYQIAG